MTEKTLNDKTVRVIAVMVMLSIGAAYMFYLLKSWEQMQVDRITRDRKIDELIDAVRPKPPVVSEGC